MHLSVIIPALDEADTLPLLLGQLRAQTGIEIEIIVADGGSRDETPVLAKNRGARVVVAQRGRAAQMNAGAAHSRAGFLLFLHADSRLPSPTFLADALRALQAAGGAKIAGHFPLRFARMGPAHDFFYRYLEGKTRSNRPHTINGDQGLLISREYFTELGGFDASLPFMEDQRISARIFVTGRWIVLPGELTTSARRFEAEGHAERLTLMALMTGAQVVGLMEFFSAAPEIYRAQGQTQRLDPAPFARRARRLMRAQGRQGLRTLYRGGGFVRENAWQLFYRRDLLRNDGCSSALDFHDRWFAPTMNNVFGNLLGTLLLWLWLLKISLS
ncbi:MAG: TIGR04283 family arsenosugar biosynthesis glycosyltransferase [Pseudomonadota bacterium]